jgi:hypothetical protein
MAACVDLMSLNAGGSCQGLQEVVLVAASGCASADLCDRLLGTKLILSPTQHFSLQNQCGELLGAHAEHTIRLGVDVHQSSLFSSHDNCGGSCVDVDYPLPFQLTVNETRQTQYWSVQ